MRYDDIRGDKATLVMFICNHCPFVIHIVDELVALAKEYQNKGVGFVAISSNDIVNYPQDAPDLMAQFAKEQGFDFPYLYDVSQAVAKAYDAACTPDFDLFDANNVCVYRGRLDGSRPGNDVPVDGIDMRAALDAVLLGIAIKEPQTPSMGCNIKWK
jgi:thiol-disulfide isomerase/thioredoxin